METSVQEALKIGLVNDQIHTIVISGGTGVGKSYVLRQCLEKWQIPYRLIPHNYKSPSILKHPLHRVRWLWHLAY